MKELFNNNAYKKTISLSPKKRYAPQIMRICNLDHFISKESKSNRTTKVKVPYNPDEIIDFR